MEDLFSSLTNAVQSSAPIALAAALVWGVLSILLSPCHLSSIPLIVAFMGEQGDRSGGRALTVSTVFALGILVTIGTIGVITATMGRMLGDVGSYVNYLLALILFLLGLHFLGVIPMPWSGSGRTVSAKRGAWAAFVLGLVFGVGVGPCTFAYMAPILGVTFKVAAQSWLFGVALLLLYGIGHCSVIVVAGTSAEMVQRYLNWSEASRGTTILRQTCGILVILGGAYLIYTAP
ncbi:MAG: cytochrome C biogenesis protein [Candidatus Eiseniibacteriota bacterium]|nr:MAG: cytochrome C biogenesis protein [Candidatus Eisenbacteria bacterium]